MLISNAVDYTSRTEIIVSSSGEGLVGRKVLWSGCNSADYSTHLSTTLSSSLTGDGYIVIMAFKFHVIVIDRNGYYHNLDTLNYGHRRQLANERSSSRSPVRPTLIKYLTEFCVWFFRSSSLLQCCGIWWLHNLETGTGRIENMYLSLKKYMMLAIKFAFNFRGMFRSGISLEIQRQNDKKISELERGETSTKSGYRIDRPLDQSIGQFNR